MMGKYYILVPDSYQIYYGPYDTYIEAADNMDDEKNEIIVKECPPENKYGAPTVPAIAFGDNDVNPYPFLTEEYDDGEEG